MAKEAAVIRIIQRQRGLAGALARDEPVQIGVAGATENEAHEGLLLALAAWSETLGVSWSGDVASSASGSEYALAA